MGSTTFRKKDLSRYVKVYPFIRRTPRWSYSSSVPANIEVAKLVFNDVSSATYTFLNNGYASVPTVTATSVEIAASAPQGADVNVFISSITRYAVTLGSSHSFNGEVHIQIIWVEG